MDFRSSKIGGIWSCGSEWSVSISASRALIEWRELLICVKRALTRQRHWELGAYIRKDVTDEPEGKKGERLEKEGEYDQPMGARIKVYCLMGPKERFSVGCDRKHSRVRSYAEDCSDSKECLLIVHKWEQRRSCWDVLGKFASVGLRLRHSGSLSLNIDE